MPRSSTGSAADLIESSTDPRSIAGRPLERSGILGQVTTPKGIAERMVAELLVDRPERPVTILDPCVGPSTFPKQIVASGLSRPGDKLIFVDLDEEMIAGAKAWAESVNLGLTAICGDYLKVPMDGIFDYAILNPPFIRQEWLDEKESYRNEFKERYGLDIPGTSNLYVYFIAKVIKDLGLGGRLAGIVYDSWQFTKYGRWLRQFMARECHSIKIVPIRDQPFQGRLIDATLIIATKGQGSKTARENVTDSHSSGATERLSEVDGFATLEKLYGTKRGLRLKQVNFFMCDSTLGGQLGATPFLKKVRLVEGYAVRESHPESALLLERGDNNPPLLAELHKRLAEAQTKPQENMSILTWHRERPSSWMFHRATPYAPIVFNYYIRNRPRHLYNPNRAYSDNFYGLLTRGLTPSLASIAILNSTAVCFEILTKARNQGNGLAKIQLYEYRDVFVPNLTVCATQDIAEFEELGRELIELPHLSEQTIERIDGLIASIFADARLQPMRVRQLFAQADRKARRPREASSCLG